MCQRCSIDKQLPGSTQAIPCMLFYGYRSGGSCCNLLKVNHWRKNSYNITLVKVIVAHTNGNWLNVLTYLISNALKGPISTSFSIFKSHSQLVKNWHFVIVGQVIPKLQYLTSLEWDSELSKVFFQIGPLRHQRN